jgi:hypothetical protein
MEYDIRPIPGFPHYLAGRDGTIWSFKRKGGNDRGPGRLGLSPRQLKIHTRRNGYCAVAFDIDGKVVSCQVGRLVLLAFVGLPPSPDHHACHYPDTDPRNNKLENLRWDTPSENAKDKYRHLWGAAQKPCSKCGIVKDRSEFYADQRNIDGLKANCKPCHNLQAVMTRDPRRKNELNREFMRRKRAADPAYGR